MREGEEIIKKWKERWEKRGWERIKEGPKVRVLACVSVVWMDMEGSKFFVNSLIPLGLIGSQMSI